MESGRHRSAGHFVFPNLCCSCHIVFRPQIKLLCPNHHHNRKQNLYNTCETSSRPPVPGEKQRNNAVHTAAGSSAALIALPHSQITNRGIICKQDGHLAAAHLLWAPHLPGLREPNHSGEPCPPLGRGLRHLRSSFARGAAQVSVHTMRVGRVSFSRCTAVGGRSGEGRRDGRKERSLGREAEVHKNRGRSGINTGPQRLSTGFLNDRFQGSPLTLTNAMCDFEGDEISGQ